MSTVLLGRLFYLLMSLLAAVVVAYGFSRTVNTRLIHPPSPRPMILYFHAVIFTGWVAFFILQSAVAKARKVKLHRRLGWFGLAMGIAIPIVGVATTIAMGRLRMREGRVDAAQFMIIPFFDMLAFTLVFALAFYWRKRPEFHRRLMLIANCSLTAAAFGRFPHTLIPEHWLYAGVDALILFGVFRDLLVARSVHPVYRCALPLLAIGQTITIHVFVSAWPVWVQIAHAMLD